VKRRRRAAGSAALAALLALGACDADPRDAAARDAAAPAPPVDPAAAPRAAVTPALPIDSTGIGAARRGMTVGEVRAALGEGVRLGEPDDRFLVDAVAVPVIEGGDTLYHLLFFGRDAVSDADLVEHVATTSPRARTTEGIGPGSTLAAAAAVYGEPTLSFHTADESREYAAFPAQPARVRFRVLPGADDATFAGEYGALEEFSTTRRYDPDARIGMVLVDLRPSSQP